MYWKDEINFEQLVNESQNIIVFLINHDNELIYANDGFRRFFDHANVDISAIFVNPDFSKIKSLSENFNGVLTVKKTPRTTVSFQAKIVITKYGILFVCEKDTLETDQLYLEMTKLSSSVSNRNRELIKKDVLLKNAYQELERKSEELEKAKVKAESANKAKSAFLSAMSHEIRTPLNGVIGFTDLLAKTTLTAVQRQYLENANASAKILLDIINDILDFSKIEAGRLELEEVETDIVELIEETADIVKFIAASKNIELLLNIASNTPRITVTDPLRMKQILVNLLSNAIKFTEKGEVELSLYSTRDIHDPGYYHYTFTVKDTGIGISPEGQKNLFKSFSQADSSISRKFGGTGLGLAISNNLVKKMGGKIDVKSRLNRGSDFSFTVKKPAITKSCVQVKTDLKIQRALIVDDNEKSRTILEQRYREWDIETVTAESGTRALNIIKTSPSFDVAVIDYNMPDTDGIETVEQIRSELKVTSEVLPVILLYNPAFNEISDEKMDDLGIVFKVVKPVKTGEMINCIKNIVQTKNHTDSDKESKQITHTETISCKKYPTILVVDDVLLNNVLIKTVLKNLIPGSTVIEAENGVKAVEHYKKHNPDIIFMDIKMPEMDGFAATGAIREIEQDAGNLCPVIALSASTDNTERAKCFDCGMNDYLEKPLNQKTLITILEKYLSE
ncbi:response regulator [Chitinispirillales bacterium ANBcel5]|uniref:response regulator n=1 Tax=Cellulosispirillum alkaliphilum TaxID=3039283 RepID=UPI002A526C32|nr:response regulator [Chitinispirillales bacterium ANBcel5]